MGLWPSTSSYLNFHPSIWTIVKKRNISSSRKHFKKCAWTFIFQHHLKIVFKLSSHSVKILRMPNLKCLAFYPPFFNMASNIFSLPLHIKLGLPHPIVHGFYWCIWTHPINSTWIHILHCAHSHTWCSSSFFASIAKDVGFHVYTNKFMLSQHHFYNHRNDEWILWL
jgi:hypothetical protein